MNTFFATPAPGRRVCHPDTGREIDPWGETIVLSSYWRRREKDGDVTLTRNTPPKGDEGGAAAAGGVSGADRSPENAATSRGEAAGETLPARPADPKPRKK